MFYAVKFSANCQTRESRISNLSWFILNMNTRRRAFGFTLIELLVIIAMTAVLATIRRTAMQKASDIERNTRKNLRHRGLPISPKPGRNLTFLRQIA
jgi:hypothetical protein